MFQAVNQRPPLEGCNSCMLTLPLSGRCKSFVPQLMNADEFVPAQWGKTVMMLDAYDQ